LLRRHARARFAAADELERFEQIEDFGDQLRLDASDGGTDMRLDRQLSSQ
jgi:hypothetical protein